MLDAFNISLDEKLEVELKEPHGAVITPDLLPVVLNKYDHCNHFYLEIVYGTSLEYLRMVYKKTVQRKRHNENNCISSYYFSRISLSSYKSQGVNTF